MTSSQYGNPKKSPVNILIATPLFPPQLGGPALYAQSLAGQFKKQGHKTEVVSFGAFLRFPPGIRHFLYFGAILKRIRRSSVILGLDYFSVGFPALIASLASGKPLILRVEGDFLWESYVERTRQDIPLPDFYKNKVRLSAKEHVIKKLSGWTLRQSRLLVFSSEWRRSMVTEAYNVPRDKTVIVRNVLNVLAESEGAHPNNSSLGLSPDSSDRAKVILWAGRMIYLKNLHRLVEAFTKANDGTWKLHLVGDGPEKRNIESQILNHGNITMFPPMAREQLFEKLASSSFFVLPSLSDVGPNVIAEAIEAGTPFIMTKYSGYADTMEKIGILVDPLNEEDLENKIKLLMDDKEREKYRALMRKTGFSRSWEEAAKEWMEVIIKVI